MNITLSEFKVFNFGAKVKQKNRVIECHPDRSYPCGKACISQKRRCKKILKGQAKNFASWLKEHSKSKQKPKKKSKIGSRTKQSAKSKKKEVSKLNKEQVVSSSPKFNATDISKAYQMLPRGDDLITFLNNTGIQTVWVDQLAWEFGDIFDQQKEKDVISNGLIRIKDSVDISTYLDENAKKVGGFTSKSWNSVVNLFGHKFAESGKPNFQYLTVKQEMKRNLTTGTRSMGDNFNYNDYTTVILTSIHEIGHQVHYRTGEIEPPTEDSISQYGATNKAEWFAEHFTLWMTNPTEYAKVDKKTTDFFEKIFDDVLKKSKKENN